MTICDFKRTGTDFVSSYWVGCWVCVTFPSFKYLLGTTVFNCRDGLSWWENIGKSEGKPWKEPRCCDKRLLSSIMWVWVGDWCFASFVGFFLVSFFIAISSSMSPQEIFWSGWKASDGLWYYDIIWSVALLYLSWCLDLFDPNAPSKIWKCQNLCRGMLFYQSSDPIIQTKRKSHF